MSKKNCLHSLGFQYILEISILIIFVCITLSTLIYNYVRKSDVAQITGSMAKRSGDIGKLVDYEINSYIQHVEDIAQRPEIQSMDFTQQRPVLIAEAKRIGFERFQVGDLNGDVISTTGERANAADRPFYKQALAGKSNISDVLYARIDLKMVIVVSCPIYNNEGKIAGVLSGVTSARKLNDILSSVRLDYEGSSFIINKTGQKMAGIDYTKATVLDNDLEKKDTASLSGLITAEKQMIAEKEGLCTFENNNKMYYLTFTGINHGEWILGIYQNKKEALGSLSKLFSTIKLLTICFIIIGIIAGFLPEKQLKPLESLGTSITGIASGNADLTKRIDLKSKNEIGTVVSGFNRFVAKLQSIMQELKQSKSILSDAGKTLQASTEDTAAEITQILSNIDSVSGQITNQSASVEETAGAVNEIASNIASLEKMIETQSAGVTQASAAVEEMVGNITSVNVSIGKMAESFGGLQQNTQNGIKKQEEINERILIIADQSKMLKEANSAISNIAEQTNLLAMNAAIEAAHAGEAGKGFSVVSDEIRKLSETSSSQSKTIGDELKKIEDSIKGVVSVSKESKEVFTQVSLHIKDTDELVHQIQRAMSEQQEGSKQINQALHDMNGSTSEVRSASAEMSAGNKAILEEVKRLQDTTVVMKDSVGEMSLGAKKIHKTGSSLRDISENMEQTIQNIGNQIDMFKV
ncbi:MAG: methyl-accepting chemotaxis protein [Treponema sp.]